MKGNQEVIDFLNFLLRDELTAISQYMVHAEMHIGRILFLEGSPVVDELNAIHIGGEVEKMFANDRKAEKDAIEAYNKGIALALKVGDNGTKELLEKILEDEEEHIDYIEEQLDQIEQMGIQNYLSTQA